MLLSLLGRAMTSKAMVIGHRAIAQRVPRQKAEPITLDSIQLANLPTRPKRPATAYNLFYTQKFDEVRRANPELKVMELSKIIAAAWKSSPKELRSKYAKESEAQAPLYREQIVEYNSFMKRKVTLEQVAKLLQQQARSLSGKRSRPTERPRKVSGWVMFMKENVQGTKGKPDLASIAAKWKQLPDSVKQQYHDRGAQENDKIK